MPSESLKPTARFSVVERVHHVDRRARSRRTRRPADAGDLELGGLERRRLDDEVALLSRILCTHAIVFFALLGRLDHEDVVVLVLEVARLVGAQPGERLGDRRRLQPHGGDVYEIDGVRHVKPLPVGDLTRGDYRRAGVRGAGHAARSRVGRRACALGPRYGIHVDEALGVSMADMKRVARGLGRDHAARRRPVGAPASTRRASLARLVDDPAAGHDPSRWTPGAPDFDSWAICDTVCFNALRPSTGRLDQARAVGRRRRAVRAAAPSFALLWSLALHDARRARTTASVAALGPRRGARRGRAAAGEQVDLDGAARGGQTKRGPAGGRCWRRRRGSGTPTVSPLDAWAVPPCASSG